MAETFCGAEGLMFGSQMTRYTEPCQGHFRFHVRPNRTTVHDYDIDERQRAGEAREAEDPHDARTEAIRGT